MQSVSHIRFMHWSTSIQHAISFTRKAYALVYLHSTCNQFHPYSAPRGGYVRNVPDECKHINYQLWQYYVRVDQFRFRSY